MTHNGMLRLASEIQERASVKPEFETEFPKARFQHRFVLFGIVQKWVSCSGPDGPAEVNTRRVNVLSPKEIVSCKGGTRHETRAM